MWLHTCVHGRVSDPVCSTRVSQGHSRTIVGAEVVAGGGQRLLVLDPSHSPARCAAAITNIEV